MKNLFSASLFVVAPIVAAVLPCLFDRFGIARALRLDRFTRPTRPGSRRFARVPGGSPSPVRPLQSAIQGVVMIASVLLGIGVAVTLSGTAGGALDVLLGSIGGAIAGSGLLVLANALISGQHARRAGRVLGDLGCFEVWKGAEGLPFRRELRKAIKRGGHLEVLTADGVDVLRAISHNAHPPLAAPHPGLRGARLRLLLVPPRSHSAEGRGGRSVAEIAIARLDRSTEEHWRLLETAFEVRDRWWEKYGVKLEILFLEQRPSFHVLFTADRSWCRPWESHDGWLDARLAQGRSALHNSLRAILADGLAGARRDLGGTMPAGPTKSTFIRNGVEVEGLREPSRLQVDDCTDEVEEGTYVPY